MSRVVSIATEVPAHRLTQEQLITRYAEMRGNDSRAMSHIPIFKHSGVETRYLTFPEEYYQSRHSFERRNRDFVEEAVRLDPNYAVARLNLAEMYRMVGREADSAEQMEAYRRLEHENPPD